MLLMSVSGGAINEGTGGNGELTDMDPQPGATAGEQPSPTTVIGEDPDQYRTKNRVKHESIKELYV